MSCIFTGDLAAQISNYVSLHQTGPYFIVVQFARIRRHNGKCCIDKLFIFYQIINRLYRDETLVINFDEI